jgi:hypothetical protein
VFNQWDWYTIDPDLASKPPFTLLTPGQAPNVTEENTRVRVGFEPPTMGNVDRQALYLTEPKGMSLQALACNGVSLLHANSLVRGSCVITTQLVGLVYLIEHLNHP